MNPTATAAQWAVPPLLMISCAPGRLSVHIPPSNRSNEGVGVHVLSEVALVCHSSGSVLGRFAPPPKATKARWVLFRNTLVVFWSSRRPLLCPATLLWVVSKSSSYRVRARACVCECVFPFTGRHAGLLFLLLCERRRRQESLGSRFIVGAPTDAACYICQFTSCVECTRCLALKYKAAIRIRYRIPLPRYLATSHRYACTGASLAVSRGWNWFMRCARCPTVPRLLLARPGFCMLDQLAPAFCCSITSTTASRKAVHTGVRVGGGRGTGRRPMSSREGDSAKRRAGLKQGSAQRLDMREHRGRAIRNRTALLHLLRWSSLSNTARNSKKSPRRRTTAALVRLTRYGCGLPGPGRPAAPPVFV